MVDFKSTKTKASQLITERIDGAKAYQTPIVFAPIIIKVIDNEGKGREEREKRGKK